MASLDLAYTDQRRTIVVKIDVLKLLKRDRFGRLAIFCWGFLPFKSDAKFRCQIHLAFDARQISEVKSLLTDCALDEQGDNYAISSTQSLIVLRCPIEKQFFRTSESSKNPVSFSGPIPLRFKHLKVPTSSLRLRAAQYNEAKLTYWIVKRGPESMFVPDRYASFESPSVVSGGRPESNRRRF